MQFNPIVTDIKGSIYITGVRAQWRKFCEKEEPFPSQLCRKGYALPRLPDSRFVNSLLRFLLTYKLLL